MAQPPMLSGYGRLIRRNCHPFEAASRMWCWARLNPTLTKRREPMPRRPHALRSWRFRRAMKFRLKNSPPAGNSICWLRRRPGGSLLFRRVAPDPFRLPDRRHRPHPRATGRFSRCMARRPEQSQFSGNGGGTGGEPGEPGQPEQPHSKILLRGHPPLHSRPTLRLRLPSLPRFSAFFAEIFPPWPPRTLRLRTGVRRRGNSGQHTQTLSLAAVYRI